MNSNQRICTRAWILSCAVAAVLVGGSWRTAQAITINITDATPTYQDPEMPSPPHISSNVLAHINPTAVSFSSNGYFDAAWNAWNNALPANQQWTKVDGGALAATLNVVKFDAANFHGNGHVGGVEIQIELDYNGADRDDLFWVQGLELNYTISPPGSSNGYPTMDTAALSGLAVTANPTKSPFGPNPDVWSGPVYPYQFTNEAFYDFPKGPFENGYFEADALLAKVDWANRKLTIFEGVHYGFYLVSVPEPSSVVMLLVGTAGLVLVGWRKRRQAAG